jgi:branched-chain amino acid transport system substrate-binding protein
MRHRRQVILSLLLAIPAASQEPPYKDARQHKRGYFGPGRDEPEPRNLNAVLIGYFGPDAPRHPQGGSAWLGASMALEEANQEGDYKGMPFRFVQEWNENPWAGGVSAVTRMAYLDRVWAVIGSTDGAATHLAEQVVAKARLALVDPVSTDESVNQANLAWMFSCVPGDRPASAAIGASLLESAAGSFALLSATDHDSRALVAEFKLFLASRKAVPNEHTEFPAGLERASDLAAQVAALGVSAVVILAGPTESARLVTQVRRVDAKIRIYGGPSMGRQSFLDSAKGSAESVLFPLLVGERQGTEAFSEKFRSRYEYEPDYAALHAYDATRIVVAAIRKAGLNRVRIMDAIEASSPWQGVSGDIRWDPLGRNSRAVRLGTIQNGRVQHALPVR